jgi:hypothetical protein
MYVAYYNGGIVVINWPDAFVKTSPNPFFVESFDVKKAPKIWILLKIKKASQS